MSAHSRWFFHRFLDPYTSSDDYWRYEDLRIQGIEEDEERYSRRFDDYDAPPHTSVYAFRHHYQDEDDERATAAMHRYEDEDEDESTAAPIRRPRAAAVAAAPAAPVVRPVLPDPILSSEVLDNVYLLQEPTSRDLNTVTTFAPVLKKWSETCRTLAQQHDLLRQPAELLDLWSGTLSPSTDTDLLAVWNKLRVAQTHFLYLPAQHAALTFTLLAADQVRICAFIARPTLEEAPFLITKISTPCRQVTLSKHLVFTTEVAQHMIALSSCAVQIPSREFYNHRQPATASYFYICESLMSFLDGLAASSANAAVPTHTPLLYKTAKDTCLAQWRRDPAWFALKSALHATMIASFSNPAEGTLVYKALMLCLHTTLLDAATKDVPTPTTYHSDNTLQQMLAKVSRRIQKLCVACAFEPKSATPAPLPAAPATTTTSDAAPATITSTSAAAVPQTGTEKQLEVASTSDKSTKATTTSSAATPDAGPSAPSGPELREEAQVQPVHAMVRQVCEQCSTAVVALKHAIQERWNRSIVQIEGSLRPDVDATALPALTPADNKLLAEGRHFPAKLENVLDFADWHHRDPARPLTASDRSVLSQVLALPILTTAAANMSRGSLDDLVVFEEALLAHWAHLHNHAATHSPALPQPVETGLSIGNLHEWFKSYVDHSSWDGSQPIAKSPLRLSMRYLAAAVMMVLSDMQMMMRLPFLLQHQLELSLEPLDALLLPEARDCRIVSELQAYIDWRARHCTTGLPSATAARPSSNTIASRISKQQDDLGQAVRKQLEAMAQETERGLAQSREEVRSCKAECERLIPISRRACTQYVGYNRYGRQYVKHDRNCQACRAQDRLRNITCSIYVKPYPDAANDQALIAFENITHPMAVEIRQWRDVVLRFQVKVFATMEISSKSSHKTWAGGSSFYYYSYSATSSMLVSSVSESKEYHPPARHVSLTSDENGYWTAFTGNAVLSLDCQSAYHLPTSWSDVQRRLREALHLFGKPPPPFVLDCTSQQSQAIAAQHRCPDNMTPAEFVTFSSLRGGVGLQWPNILAALERQDLAFLQPQVTHLLCQAAWQVEGRDTSALHPTQRTPTRLLTDHSFVRALGDALRRSVQVYRVNRKFVWGMCSLVVLTNAALSVYASQEAPQPELLDTLNDILAECRQSLSEWVAVVTELRKSLALNTTTDKATLSELDAECLRVLALISLVGIATFHCTKATLAPRTSDGADAMPTLFYWLQFIAVKYDAMVFCRTEVARDAQFLLVFANHIVHTQRDRLRGLAATDLNGAARALTQFSSDQCEPGRLGFIKITNELELTYHWVKRAAQGEATMLLVEMLTGKVLINGLPKGKLLPEVLRHDLYSKYFCNLSFTVFSDPTSPIGPAQKTESLDGRHYVFGLRSDKRGHLYILEQHQNAFHLLIPHELLQGYNLPVHFSDFVVWYSLQTQQLLFFAKDRNGGPLAGLTPSTSTPLYCLEHALLEKCAAGGATDASVGANASAAHPAGAAAAGASQESALLCQFVSQDCPIGQRIRSIFSVLEEENRIEVWHQSVRPPPQVDVTSAAEAEESETDGCVSEVEGTESSTWAPVTETTASVKSLDDDTVSEKSDVVVQATPEPAGSTAITPAVMATRTLVTLPRLGLQFVVEHNLDDPSKRAFNSVDFPEFSVDPQQGIGALVGLTHGLVLVAHKGRPFEERMFLVPHGPVERHKSVKGSRHQVTAVQRESLIEHSPYFAFTVLQATQQIKAPDNLSAWIYLSLLFANTSAALPDPLTGLTGAESAVAILQRAACTSLDALDDTVRSALVQMSHLSPVRSLQRQQQQQREKRVNRMTVDWPANLPSLCALDAYVILVDRKFSDAHQLDFLRTSTSAEDHEREKETEASGHAAFQDKEHSMFELARKACHWFSSTLPLLTHVSHQHTTLPTNMTVLTVPSFDMRSFFIGHFMHKIQQGQHDAVFPLADQSRSDFLTGINEFGPNDLGFDSLEQWKGMRLPFHLMGVHHFLNQHRATPESVAPMLEAGLFLAFQGYIQRENANSSLVNFLVHAWAADKELVPPPCRTFVVAGLHKPESAWLSASGCTLAKNKCASFESFLPISRPAEPRSTFSTLESAQAAQKHYEEEMQVYNRRRAEYQAQYDRLVDLVKIDAESFFTDVARVHSRAPYGADDPNPSDSVPEVAWPNPSRTREILDSRDVQDIVRRNLEYANLQHIRTDYIQALYRIDQPRWTHSACPTSVVGKRFAAYINTQDLELVKDYSTTVTLSVSQPRPLNVPITTALPLPAENSVIATQLVTEGWDALCTTASFTPHSGPGLAAMQAAGLLTRHARTVLFANAQRPSARATREPESHSASLVREIFDDSFHAQVIHQLAAEVCQQREVRLLKHQHQSQRAALNKDLDTPPHRVWDPQQRPQWVLIEWENNLCIRDVQVEVALRMIESVRGDANALKNAMLQLDMGEGKTSVIAPMVLAVLSDGNRLARLVVLTSLLNSNLRLFRFRLGGLLNRRFLCAPFSRDVALTPENLDLLLKVYQSARTRGDVVITVREFLLSLELKYLEACTGGNNSRPTPATDQLGRSIGALLQFLHSYSRDVIDEVDEVLHHRFQLVYPLGLPQKLDGGELRWRLEQLVLYIVRGLAADFAARFTGAVASAPERTGTPRYSSFPRVQLLIEHERATEAYKWLCEEIFKRLADPDFKPAFLSAQSNDFVRWMRRSDREALRVFLLDNTAAHSLDGLGDAEAVLASDTKELFQNGLLCLRGVLAHDVLMLVLRKRFRVEFGLHPNRAKVSRLDLVCKRRILLAVPYRAKDVAADNTEFGHPDTSLLLTMLAYYWTGLTDDNIDMLLHTLSTEAAKDSIFEQWINETTEFPPGYPVGLKRFSGLDLDDKSTLIQYIYPLLRFHVCAINYFLDQEVLPKQVKEFEYKILANAWSLVRPGRPNPATGFSGTSDSAPLLPLWAEQHNLPSLENTNVQVDEDVKDPSNNYYFELPALCTSDQLLELLSTSSNVLVDAGAVVLDLSNREFSRLWLTKRHDCSAVVYFDETNNLCVLVRSIHGNEFTDLPLELSPYQGGLDKACLAYIDHAHMRGTDLRLPVGTRGAITLGKGLCRDEFVQACKRMRLLGRGHSLCFCAPAPIDAQLRQGLNGIAAQKVTAEDVLNWCKKNSEAALREAVFMWGLQGLNSLRTFHVRPLDFGGNALPRMYVCRPEHDVRQVSPNFRLPDRQTLKAHYDGAVVARLVPELVRQLAETHQLSGLTIARSIMERAANLAADVRRFERDLEEQQEREAEQEREDVHNRELPPPCERVKEECPVTLANFVSSGDPRFVEIGFPSVWHNIQEFFPSAPRPRHCDLRLLGSPSFCNPVRRPTFRASEQRFNHLYLRPLRWLVCRRDAQGQLTHVIAISPCEAKILLNSQHYECFHESVSLVFFAPPIQHGASPLWLGPWTPRGTPLINTPTAQDPASLSTWKFLLEVFLYSDAVSDYATSLFSKRLSEADVGEIFGEQVARFILEYRRLRDSAGRLLHLT
eukprot:m.186464 g.186464  ORF g.186464 m.186464 type:complete len:3511 (+) comp15410_c1_seq4:293-10825(+)